MKLKGHINICRSQSNVDGSRIHIEIVDESSGCRLVDGYMTLEAFGSAVTGLSHQDFEFEFRPECAGKTREHKIIDVPVSEKFIRWTKDKKEEVLKPFETDGWRGYHGDLGNGHKSTKTGYNVGFTRYV